MRDLREGLQVDMWKYADCQLSRKKKNRERCDRKHQRETRGRRRVGRDTPPRPDGRATWNPAPGSLLPTGIVRRFKALTGEHITAAAHVHALTYSEGEEVERMEAEKRQTVGKEERKTVLALADFPERMRIH